MFYLPIPLFFSLPKWRNLAKVGNKRKVALLVWHSFKGSRKKVYFFTQDLKIGVNFTLKTRERVFSPRTMNQIFSLNGPSSLLSPNPTITFEKKNEEVASPKSVVRFKK